MQRLHVFRAAAVGLALASLAPHARSQPTPVVTDAQAQARQIFAAIEAIKFELLKAQQPDGSWADPPQSYGKGGHTAIVTWALLQAGQDPFSPPIRKALDNLLTVDMDGVYNRSLRCMVMAAIARIDPTSKYARAMHADAKFLVDSRLANGQWTYHSPRAPRASRFGDNSNTQFAILALREAAVAGAAMPAGFWPSVSRYWEGVQNEDGGFNYGSAGGSSYGSMTAAGLASLFIAEDMARGARCCVGALPEPMQGSLDWLSGNFKADTNPNAGQWWLYWLYSVERVAEMSGYRYFGPHDWLGEGGAVISSRVGGDPGRFELYEQAFALTFLAKSVAPMVCNKLQFGDDWNPNPLDAPHVSRYLSSDVFERHLNWQILDLGAPLTMYHEAPILLVTTSSWPDPKDPVSQLLAERLYEFCETGGTVLVDHTCSVSAGFAKDFRAFLKRVWPDRELEMLPANHPIYQAHFPLDRDVPLAGLGNGCRQLVLLNQGKARLAGAGEGRDRDEKPDDRDRSVAGTATRPGSDAAAGTEGEGRTSADAAAPVQGIDLSCTWQKAHVAAEPAAFRIAANILMYATDKQLRPKLEPPSSLPRAVGGGQSGMPVARLRYDGNWNPCPLALPMLGQVLEARAGLGLRVGTTSLEPGSLLGTKVLVISGQGRKDWTQNEVEAIRTFIQGGGCVLGDALMGDRAFAASLRRLAAATMMLPPRPILEADPLITGRFDSRAFDLSRVQYSRALRWRKGAAGPPALEGVRLAAGGAPPVGPAAQGGPAAGRWAFIISPYDLTNGLTTARPFDMQGYAPDDAARIAANCMLYFSARR